MVVYVLCPANRISGGIELAYQLCNAINRLTDIKSYMWYVDIDDPYFNNYIVDMAVPDDYKIYDTQCIKSLNDFFEMDSNENVVVVPEALTLFLLMIQKAKKALWWMSVDNYRINTKEENISDLAYEIDIHLYQSYYAMDYVKKNIPNNRGMFLSDYINEQHGQFIFPSEFRRNIAFYNPKKGYENIKPLIERTSWLHWIPLQGMSREKMIVLMQSGKIYVDFGNHPGKDRIPREAAANGCCVITNKAGSAAYFEDIPIPEDYKFSNPLESIDEIDSLLHDICDNFDIHQRRFESYRNVIKQEKIKFENAVIEFVETLKKM